MLLLAVFACKSDEPDPDAPCRSDVCVVAGTGAPGAIEDETSAIDSPLYGPMDVTVWTGPDDFFIADWNNHKIRHVLDGTVRTIVGTVFLGDGDPDFQERIPPGIAGTEVALNHPTSAEWNPVTGKLLLPSWHNHRVREWTPETGNSLVVCADTDIADGNGANAGFAGDGGPAADALMAFPNSIAIDPQDGSFWLLPQSNRRIRWVAADYSLIDTIAGTGEDGYSGDGGPADEAEFHFWDQDDLQPEPAGAIEFDPDTRTLYVADTSNHVIRAIDVDSGVIDAVYGTGSCEESSLCYPRDVELGPDGDLYIADEGNHRIVRLDPEGGTAEPVLGTGDAGQGQEGAAALDFALDRPYGIDLADDGTLLVADTYNHRILRVKNP